MTPHLGRAGGITTPRAGRLAGEANGDDTGGVRHHRVERPTVLAQVEALAAWDIAAQGRDLAAAGFPPAEAIALAAAGWDALLNRATATPVEALAAEEVAA